MSANAGPLEALASEWFQLLGVVAIEAAIVGLLLVLLARFSRRLPSSVRYGVLLVAVAKFLLPPVTAPWSASLEVPDFGVRALLAGAPAAAPAQREASEPGDASLSTSVPPGAAPATIPFDTTVLPSGHDTRSGTTPYSFHPSEPAAGGPEGTRLGGLQPGETPVARRATGQAGSLGSPGGGAPGPSSAASPPPLASPVPAPDPRRVLVALLVVQIVGACWLLARRARQHVDLARRAHRCHEVRDPALHAALRAACRDQGVRRVPRLLASPDGFGPAASGLWRRRIFIPTIVLERIPASKLQPVLVHEVAHHRRGGLWVDTALFLGSLVWWLHPVFWLVGGELRRCREECCDAAALSHASSPGAYCQRLLDIAALVGRRPHAAAVAPGSLSHPLGRRIRNIMNGNVQKPQFSVAWVLVILSLTAFAGPTFTAYGARIVEHGLLLQNISFSVRNGVIDLSDGAIDALVERGLDRDFVEQLDGAEDRDLSIADLRQWVPSGFDAGLADELEAFGIRSLTTMEALRLVWIEVTADYVASLRQIGFTGIDAGDIGRLARYGVTAQYIADYRALGYDDLDVDDLVRLRRYDVEADYAGAYLAGGYDPSVDDLVRLSRYEVEPANANAYSAAGYELSVDDLVRLRRYEVEPEYAATYREAGYELSVDDLVRLNRYEVDQDAVARLSAAGVEEFSVDDLVRLQRYGVGEEYIRAVTEDGTHSVSVDDLVLLNRYDVTADYVRQLRATDPDLRIEDAVRLKRYEVDPGMVQRLEQMGHGDVSTDDLVRLHRYNVDLDYLAGLEALGYEDLSVDDLVLLQRYEVEVAALEALAESGYVRLSVSDVARLQRYGVDAATIRAMSAASTRQLSVDDLVTLKRYEVEPEYIAGLATVGFAELGTDDVVRLKRYEVEPSFIEQLQSAGFEDLDVDQIIRLKRAAR